MEVRGLSFDKKGITTKHIWKVSFEESKIELPSFPTNLDTPNSMAASEKDELLKSRKIAFASRFPPSRLEHSGLGTEPHTDRGP